MVSLIALGPVARALFSRYWFLLCWIDTGPAPAVPDTGGPPQVVALHPAKDVGLFGLELQTCD